MTPEERYALRLLNGVKDHFIPQLRRLIKALEDDRVSPGEALEMGTASIQFAITYSNTFQHLTLDDARTLLDVVERGVFRLPAKRSAAKKE